MKQKLTKAERHKIYKKAYEMFKTKHYSSPFICHILSYCVSGDLAKYKCDSLIKLFPEFGLFSERHKSYFGSWFDYNKERSIVLLLLIEMTKPQSI